MQRSGGEKGKGEKSEGKKLSVKYKRRAEKTLTTSIPAPTVSGSITRNIMLSLHSAMSLVTAWSSLELFSAPFLHDQSTARFSTSGQSLTKRLGTERSVESPAPRERVLCSLMT